MTNKNVSQPVFRSFAQDRDVMVPMRDGKRLAADIYRPEAEGRFPALLAFAAHNKFLQSPEVGDACNNQPAWAPLWAGAAEGGDTRFLTARGYVHVVGNPRGFGNSDPGDQFVEGRMDAYDLIEWIAQQPWCDGNVGMIGISDYGRRQLLAAMTQPPHLKAIFPFDPGSFSFRDAFPGAVMHPFVLGLLKHNVSNMQAAELTPREEELWEEAFANPDYRMYPLIFNLLQRKGKIDSRMFRMLINPYETDNEEQLEQGMGKINIPMYTGSGWYAYTYKQHLLGACRHWRKAENAPFKKLLFAGPAHLPRPWSAFHDEILRWYDYWLKGIDTGIRDEPRVKIWVMGANRWRLAEDWPLPETNWTKLYLESWERLRWEPFTPASRDGIDAPDCFAQMPLTQTSTVQKLKYLTDPLPEDLEVTGPLSLHFWAEIDQDDTNWIVILKDVGPDVSVQTARAGEMERAQVHEREITRGWLKASHRAVDEAKSLPGRPHHPFTRGAHKAIVPGEINRYDVEILPTSNLFKRDHRICVEITSLDVPSAVSGDTAVVYIPWHICSSKTVVHKVYRCQKFESYLMLPIVGKSPAQGA